MKLLILSSISGLLSYLSVALPHLLSLQFSVSDDTLFIFPGVLFGLFILVPLVEDRKHRLMRRISVLLLSIVAWYVAVSLGLKALPLIKQSPVLSCAVSGVIGVLLLAVASRYLIPVKIRPASIVNAACAGFLGGCIIGLAYQLPRASMASEAFYFLGFLSWHCSVALTLFSDSRVEKTGRILRMRSMGVFRCTPRV